MARLLLWLIVVCPAQVTAPWMTVQLAGLTFCRVLPSAKAIVSAVVLPCAFVLPLKESIAPEATVVGEL